MLLETAAANPGRVAFSDPAETITFGRLVEDASRVAARLAEAGVAAGDRVAVIRRNGVGLARALCGVHARGATAVPLGPLLRPVEIERCLAPGRPRAALVEADARPELREALARAGVPAGAVLAGDEARPDAAPSPPDPREEPGRAAYDLFSTGSTGRPKRVVRTHGMLAADAAAYQAAARLTPEDRIAGVAPLYHSYGISCVLNSVLASGASAHLFGEFVGEDLLRAITERRCTVYPGSAFHFSLLADMADRHGTDLSSLRLCFSCGLGLPAAVEAKFRARYGVRVHQMYGATECSSATMNLGGDHDRLVESVGRPLQGMEVAVVGEDGGARPPGAEGEVAVRGPSVALRYEDLPDVSAQTFRGGWFRSGDLGRLDAEGNLWITGRIKLMINAAGNKVDPLEVERVLCEHPAVAEAAVVGVPGPHAVELVKAVVVPRGAVTERDLREFCRDRLAAYKVPRTFRFAEKLPRSPTGKLLRKDLID
jgi:long-chain acyl-CoA synthetase